MRHRSEAARKKSVGTVRGENIFRYLIFVKMFGILAGTQAQIILTMYGFEM